MKVNEASITTAPQYLSGTCSMYICTYVPMYDVQQPTDLAARAYHTTVEIRHVHCDVLGT